MFSVPDSSHELVSHDQTDSLVDDFASRHVDRNHGALIDVLLLRTFAPERDAEPEFLHFLRRSNANDPVLERAWLMQASQLEEKGFCPERVIKLILLWNLKYIIYDLTLATSVDDLKF